MAPGRTMVVSIKVFLRLADFLLAKSVLTLTAAVDIQAPPISLFNPIVKKYGCGKNC
jgi:hypothetical protein